MLLLRERARADFGDVRLECARDLVREVRVPLDEPRRVPLVQAKQVVPDEHLPVALGTGADADRRDRQCFGDAGVGKTRLTQEFLDSIGDRVRVVRGRCLPYGEGITFWPIVGVVGDAAGIETDQIRPAAREACVVALGITTLSMLWSVPRST